MFEPIKVLLITECYPSKDKPQYCIFFEQQIFALIKLGYNIDVIIPKLCSKNTCITNETYNNINIYHIGYKCIRYNLFSSFTSAPSKKRLHNFIANGGYKLLSVHITSDTVLDIATSIARSLSIKIAAHYHGLNVWQEYTTVHPIREAHYSKNRERILNKTDAVIGVSNKVSNIISERINSKMVYTVYNGVNIEFFSAAHKYNNDTCNILSVGNLIPIKGHSYLIEAFSKIAKENQKAELYILGDGPEKNNLKLFSERLNIADKVHFEGYLDYDSVATYMNNADIFVLPSYFEALGCVYLEAMACEIPVIGIEGQGIDEIIKDGENGLLAKPKDIDSLYEKMTYLINNPEKAKAIAERGLITAKTYTWNRSALELDEIYKHIIGIRLLFVTSGFHPSMGANTIIIENISKELIKSGHEVHILPFYYNSNYKTEEYMNGINIHRILKSDNIESLKHFLKSGKLIAVIRIVFKIIAIKISKGKLLWTYNSISAERQLKYFIKENNIDIAISKCCPFEISLPFYNLRKHGKLPCKWIFYMLDPFASHSYYLENYNKQHLRSWQHKIMKYADRVYLTDLIKAELCTWEKEKLLNKCNILNFPKIIKPEYEKAKDDLLFDKNKINILYVGSKNEKVRSSEYILDLCSVLNETNIVFCFVGCGWENNESSGNIQFFSKISHQAIINAEMEADILINIGNSVDNQIPSKIFEYISSGKPIINTYKIINCPTLPYLEKYPRHLNIYEADSLEVNARKISDFINNKYISELKYEDIEKIYKEFSVKSVCENFLYYKNGEEWYVQ